MNSFKITVKQYESILACFPIDWQEKLRLYTAEELYYVYRLCVLEIKPSRITKDYSGSGLFMLTVKAKLMRWLKGNPKVPGAFGVLRDAPPINPLTWGKIGRRWTEDFLEGYVFTHMLADESQLDRLREELNRKRVA